MIALKQNRMGVCVCNVHQNETELDNVQENDIIWN